MLPISSPLVSGINIGLDHTQFLGNTLDAIASKKEYQT
jgi:folylpolyglutamate synthase/dihydropteroate synthase